MLRFTLGWLGLAITAFSVVGAFYAYVVSAPDPHSGVLIDGFGRTLQPTPSMIRALFQSDYWAGPAWWLFDMVLFWISFFGGIALIAFATEQNRR